MKTATILFVAALALCAPASRAVAEAPSSRTVYASVRAADGSVTITVNGAAFGPWREVVGLPAAYPDSSHWGLLAATLDRGWVVMVDGKAVASFKASDYMQLWDFAMSADGRTWSVRADQSGTARARSFRIVNGKAFGPYEVTEPVAFSATGGGWGFRASSGAERYLVANGKRYGPYSFSGEPGFDPDGAVSFAAGSAAGNKIIVDDKEYGPFDEVDLLFAGDGNCVGYWAALKGGKQQWVVGKKTYGPYDYVDRGRAWFSADGKDWLVRVYKGSSSILLRAGKETALGRLDTPGLPKGYLYTWEEGPGMYVVFNGAKSGPYQTGRNLMWTADGSAWAMMHKTYPTGPGRALSYVTVNGTSYPGSGLVKQAGPGGEGFAWASGGFESDGLVQTWRNGVLASRTVFRVERTAGGLTVSAGGASFGPYEEIVGDPVIDPTGSHWGLLALEGPGVYAVLVDGAEAGHFAFERAVDFSMNPEGTGWCFTGYPVWEEQNARTLVLNGSSFGPYRAFGSVGFSSDGRRYAFVAEAAGGKVLIVDGKTWGPYAADFEEMRFDLDGGAFAARIRLKGSVYALTETGQSGPYREVETIDDGAGKLFGWVATAADGSMRLFRRGQVYGPYQSLDFRRRYVSPGGGHWLIPLRLAGTGEDALLDTGSLVNSRGLDLRPMAGGWLLFIRDQTGERIMGPAGSWGPWTRVERLLITRDGGTWVAGVSAGEGPSQTGSILVNGAAYPGEGLLRQAGTFGERFSWITRLPDGSATLHWITVP